MLGRGQQTLSDQLLAVVRIEGLEQFGQLPGAEVGVDLGDLLGQLVAVALAEAARHIDALDPAILLRVGELEDGVDALLLGAFDEAAGVDDDHGCGLHRGVVGDVEVVGPELVLSTSESKVFLAQPRVTTWARRRRRCGLSCSLGVVAEGGGEQGIHEFRGVEDLQVLRLLAHADEADGDVEFLRQCR